MRKLVLSFAILLSLTFMTSCGGGGPVGDAKKMAGVLCELNELADDVEGNKDKIKALMEKSEKMQKEMAEKYKDMKEDKEMGKKVQEAMNKTLEGCGLSEDKLGELMMKIMKVTMEK